MTRTMIFCELQNALAEAGCAVCRLVAKATERYLDGLLWEGVNDPGVRPQIRRAHGFCHDHAWMLARPGASLGVAILTRDVLQSLLAEMKGIRFQTLPTWSLRRVQESLDRDQPARATADLVARLTPQAQCPACVQARRMEEVYLDTLLDHLVGKESLLAAYQASDGLCLPHFRQALARLRGEKVFDALVTAQQTIWQRLADQLSEMIRKSDYRFHDEEWGEESGAWLRALAALTGPQREKTW